MHGTKMYKVSLNLCAWWGQGVYSVLSKKQPTQHLKACFCRTHKFWVGKWKDEWPAAVHVWRLQRDLPWSDHWLHWRLQFCWRPCGHKPLQRPVVRRIRLKLARARQAVDLVFGGEGAMGHGKSLGRQQQGARSRFLTWNHLLIGHSFFPPKTQCVAEACFVVVQSENVSAANSSNAAQLG